jgi:hypothetical protein
MGTNMRSMILLFAVANAALAAAPAKFSSGATRTHLLELYSSEGCSSCPPAEQWLGALRDDPRLWRDFVPVAFHVVYWDQLGWRDRFASKDFTDREYTYARDWASDSVYTPCFVLDGGEWRSAFSRKPPQASGEVAGVLSAVYDETGRLKVTFDSPEAERCEVHAAILGGGIVSGVAAGENEGRTLHHDFVALTLRSAPLHAGAAELSLPLPKVAGVNRHALAVWVTRRGEIAPLQATGGWLD